MKRIILGVLALVAAGAAMAQESYSRWSLTPKAGLTVATFAGDDATDNSSSLAWAAGLEASLRPSNLLSYDFGLFYTRDRVKESGTDVYTMMTSEYVMSHYRLLTERIDMPLMVGLHVLPGLTLKTGVQPSFLVSATTSYHLTGYYEDYGKVDEQGQHPKIPLDEQEKMGFKSHMRDLDFGIPIGASYEWRNIVVDARYNFSLRRVHKGQHAHRRYLLLTLGYRLPL